MTPSTVRPDGTLEPRVTLEDVKHRAETVRDLAVSEVKDVAGKVVDDSAGRTLLIVAGVVIVAASLAFYLGTRSGGRDY